MAEAEVEVRARADARLTHQVVVDAVELLTPNMRRIAFAGEALATLSVPLPAQWLKVVLPASLDGMQANRAYTIRHFHPDRRRMEIDFVLHGDAGPASAWAGSAKVGDVVHLSSPRGGYRVDPDAHWRLLAGDETALPAIASILDALPVDGIPTYVVVEVPSLDDVQPLCDSGTTVFQWVAREDSGRVPGHLLQEMVAMLPLSDARAEVFLAGEATAVKAIKRDLAQRAPLARIDAKGYWLLGHADHKDKT